MGKGNKYLFKFYLHARHSIGTDKEAHPHSWEICLHIKRDKKSDLYFKEVETFVETYFQQYEGKLLNETPPFYVLTPTMEHMGSVFFKELSIEIQQLKGLSLDSLEISENPTRTYIVSEYEAYFHDMRKEIEAEILRFKQGQQESIEKPMEKTVTHTVQVAKESLPIVELSPHTIPRSIRAKKERKSTKAIFWKFATGIVAVMAVGLLIYYRTML